MDIKDFFLQTKMNGNEYMRIHKKYFAEELRKKYNIENIVANDGFVYCRIKKGVYGLKQVIQVAYDDLKNHLAKFGYYPDHIATNIWTHNTR